MAALHPMMLSRKKSARTPAWPTGCRCWARSAPDCGFQHQANSLVTGRAVAGGRVARIPGGAGVQVRQRVAGIVMVALPLEHLERVGGLPFARPASTPGHFRHRSGSVNRSTQVMSSAGNAAAVAVAEMSAFATPKNNAMMVGTGFRRAWVRYTVTCTWSFVPSRCCGRTRRRELSVTDGAVP